MSRLVRHPLTSEPVLLSPERGERPGAWSVVRADEGSPPAACPFCPGNEEETPPEISRHEGDGHWVARVVPNKYPAIAPVDGVASHEVLIDTAEHVSPLETRDLSSLASMVRLWRERFTRHASRAGIESVILFRNEGRAAGQSLEHPHSQLIALPFVPPRLQAELRGFESAGSCPLCPPSIEARDGGLVVAKLDGLTLLCPSAPRLPYETWIVPDRHEADWTDCDPGAMAEAIRVAARALRNRWPGAAFNLAISSAPLRAPGRSAFHWHLEVLPRLTNLAGFELATGSWMNIVDPSRAAAEYRAALERIPAGA
jgi:UDPglucose--hexose-1-phosphate uridylyltransferase